MITRLTIKNYALIQDITANFESGFTVITGETGSGKSILLDALSLALGKRADLNSVKNKGLKCVVEAEFSIEGHGLQPVFESLDIDYEEPTILRREILPSGKSRAFINDSPTTLQTLEELSYHLLDIHTQHQSIQWEEGFMFSLVDVPAALDKVITDYQKKFSAYSDLQRKWEALAIAKKEIAKQSDYHRFLLVELQDAQLVPGELEQLETELETLQNVESIQEKLSEIIQLSDAESIGITTTLREVQQRLNRLQDQSSLFKSLFERIQSVVIEYEDIYREIENFSQQIEAQPERLETINQRLQWIHRLQTKHAAQTVEDLLAIQKSLEKQVYDADEIDQKMEQMQSDLQNLEGDLQQMAQALHNQRMKIAPQVAQQAEDLLASLGLPNARIQILVQPGTDYTPYGTDKLQILFSANKGSEPGELKNIASGGELSRVVLVFKYILAQYTRLPSIIFDEIDTGVSGETAQKMAEMFLQMSQKMQVFCITHLPQVAAKGHHHIKVYKQDVEEVTQTQITFLNHEQRLEELASMLGGEKKSASAWAHARELLN